MTAYDAFVKTVNGETIECDANEWMMARDEYVRIIASCLISGYYTTAQFGIEEIRRLNSEFKGVVDDDEQFWPAGDPVAPSM